MKFKLNRAGVIAVAATFGLAVGTVFMPAIAETIAPVPSASPESSVAPSPQVTDVSPEPTATEVPVWQPTRSILDALEAEYRAQVWLQIADVYRELCLDEGDYGHVLAAIEEFTTSGRSDIAELYQDRLDEHNALVESSNEQIDILRSRLNDVITTHGWALHDQTEAIYQASLERSRTEGRIAGLLRSAQAGLDNAQNRGLSTEPWVKQINALEQAELEFTHSRQGF